MRPRQLNYSYRESAFSFRVHGGVSAHGVLMLL
jgi:hypothetical protein